MSLLKKVFGDPNEKMLKSLQVDVDTVNGLENDFIDLSDQDLQKKALELKDRAQNGEVSLDEIMHEAFALVREAAKRTLNQRHYDVQLIGGTVLHRGMIAEMRTGEGKTLTSTLPIFLNALSGKGVHAITVNDYLAKRDAVWMGQIFHFLGLTVGCIQHESGYIYDESFKADDQDDENRDETGSFKVQMDFLRPVSRKEAYACDVTYGTNNEFGFDYLRDNMVTNPEQMVQRELNFAIVDEIDSILIDEARTPLIISAPAEESAENYRKFAGLVKDLKENEDYNIDEKMRASTFTDAGIQKIEKRLGVENLYVSGGLELVHHAEQALKAHAIFQKDKDYVVQDGEVKIVDQFTGRIMEGRRYSDGLHQALEAKEGVDIRRESRTLATITFQNYFRMYNKLSGMTGTALTEAEEFSKIYDLEVVDIPTNRPIQRIDGADKIFKTAKGKLLAMAEDVKKRQEKGQPVLIGTISIEDNVVVSQLLKQAGVRHEVLNAKEHEREGEVIAQAGRKGSVTVATNMAGRGVDIVLGGNPSTKEEQEEIRALGGLCVIGTERHESRRIDNQLRGRSGRQGDPGETQFYVSTEDSLMRIFGGDRVKNMMETMRVDETMSIENKMLSRSIESAQKRVEGRNFDTRKHLLEYDDVLNKHREAIYERRRKVLFEEIQPLDELMEILESEVERIVYFHTSEKSDIPEQFKNKDQEKGDWDPQEIIEVLNTISPISDDLQKTIKTEFKIISKDQNTLARQRSLVIEEFIGEVEKNLEEAKTKFDIEKIQKMLRNLILKAMDNMWVRHLDDMTYLRRTIGLRGYGQRDPLIEYKKESFDMFGQLEANISKEIVYNAFKLLKQATVASEALKLAPSIFEKAKLQFAGAAKTMQERGAKRAAANVIKNAPVKNEQKIGRNDPCHCGSGKKFKKCHGAE